MTMFRHTFRQQIKAITAGDAPVATERYAVRAGNYIGDKDEVINLG